jgi:hypothetical protein
MGFGLVIGFIAHLQFGITSNYSAITDPHTLPFTRACTVLSVCCVFTGCCLVMTLSVIDSSASVFYGYGPRWWMPISQLTLQSSKGYPSCPYESWTALPNCLLKTVCLQAHSQSLNSLTNCLTWLESSQSSLALLGSSSWQWTFHFFWFMSSQAGDHLTLTSACWLRLLAPEQSPSTAVSRLLTHSNWTHGDDSTAELSTNWLLKPTTGSPDVASAQTQQKTVTLLVWVTWCHVFHRCVTASCQTA